jgi:TorA maturation chaperone TorD
MREQGLERAIAAAGGISALARIIGVSQPAVSGWTRVPPDRVLAVEAATGIPRTDLRPDLYPSPPSATLDEIDAARADLYALLASLLWRAPDAAFLRRLAAPVRAEGELGTARTALAEAAASTDPRALEREHFNLFIGVAGGELFPYASYYLTGFLFERPLADVRTDLQRLGLTRAEEISEPEDHIAFLCEVMALLIRGETAPGLDDAVFFRRHLEPWARGFFADLGGRETARFYRAVGWLGRLVMEIEAAAFALSGEPAGGMTTAPERRAAPERDDWRQNRRKSESRDQT